MAHHEQNVALLQVVKGCTFWKNTADKFMCDLTAAFLVGALWIAVDTLLRTSPNSVHSMDTGSVNSLPLSVRMIGNIRQNCSCSNVSYSHSKTSVTDRAVFLSLRNASMRFELRKNTVSSTSPPLRPSTESISTTGMSGLAAVYARKSS